jgi:protein disulfide-isomerase A1
MEEEDLQTSGTELMRVKDTKEARKILASSGPLMIVVYAKWCGHCQAMFETWKELAVKVKGKARVHVIEAAQYTDKDIDGYPNMRIVKKGKVKKYDGGRSVEEMSAALLGTSLGGKRSRRNRSKLLVRRVRKTSHRTLRRNVTFV